MELTGNSCSFIVPEKITNPDPITRATKERHQLNRKYWHNEFNDFLSWAIQKIDWYDHIIDREDEIFEKVDRETLELK